MKTQQKHYITMHVLMKYTSKYLVNIKSLRLVNVVIVEDSLVRGRLWRTGILGLHLKMYMVPIRNVLRLWWCRNHSFVADHVETGLVVGNMINCFTIIVVQVYTYMAHCVIAN